MVYTINVLIKKYLLRKSNSFLSQSEAEFEINLWYFVAKSSFSFNQLLNTVASNSEFTYKIVELVWMLYIVKSKFPLKSSMFSLHV